MTFSGFVLTIIAATIAGVIVHRVKDADLWRPTAYVTTAGAALCVPIVATSYGVLTANYWIDIGWAGGFAAMYSLFARYPSRAIRSLACSLPIVLLALAYWAGQAIGTRELMLGMLSIYPLIYIVSILVMMPLLMAHQLRMSRSGCRSEHEVTWSLQPGV